VKRGHFSLHAGDDLHLVEGHDDGAGFKRGASVVDAHDREVCALNGKYVAGLFPEIAGQQIAQQNLRHSIVKAVAGDNGEGIKLEGVGAPAINQRIHFRRQVHEIKNHGSHLSDIGDGADFDAEGLIDRAVKDVALHDRDVDAGARIHPHPLMLEGARKSHQGHKGADAHGDPDQRQQCPEPPAPEILPGEPRKRELGSH
jgi:hypothetical protein